MFIATRLHQGSRSLGAKTGCERLPMQLNAVALLRSAGTKKRTAGYKHLAPNGAKSNNVLLHI
jgi:hypothetical protein